MPTYIDKDELLAVADRLIVPEVFEAMKNIANSIPAADVVEVVRCKDCKKSVCIGERYFCDIQYDEWGQPYVVKPDGFCDVGERKEAEK